MRMHHYYLGIGIFLVFLQENPFAYSQNIEAPAGDLNVNLLAPQNDATSAPLDGETVDGESVESLESTELTNPVAPLEATTETTSTLGTDVKVLQPMGTAKTPEVLHQETWESYSKYLQGQDEKKPENGIKVENIIETPSEYRYAMRRNIDPFIPPLDYGTHKHEKPIVSLLQRYSLEDLKVVGIWELSDGTRKTLIMTDKDEGVISREGDYIGNKNGKIHRINPTNIVAREIYHGYDGTHRFLDTIMWLGKEQKNNAGGNNTVRQGGRIGSAAASANPSLYQQSQDEAGRIISNFLNPEAVTSESNNNSSSSSAGSTNPTDAAGEMSTIESSTNEVGVSTNAAPVINTGTPTNRPKNQGPQDINYSSSSTLNSTNGNVNISTQ